MPEEILIDVSELEAPEPFEKVVALVSAMKPGQYIRMLHRKQPLPLIQMLEDNGYACRAIEHQPSDWEILIWNKSDVVPGSVISGRKNDA